MKKNGRLLLFSGIFSLLVLLTTSSGSAQSESGFSKRTHIFFSAGCVDCWPYVEEVLIPALQKHDYAPSPEIHDYTVPAERALLLQVAESIDLPRSVADSLYAFVPIENGTLVVMGHVPDRLIENAVKSPDLPPKLVVWQPEMHGDPTEYRLWAWVGDVQTFPIETPISEALEKSLAAGGPLPVGMGNLEKLLPVVIITGLADSVNPCAFAVILLLLAFLFTLRKSRNRILQLGLVYIGMIFLVYFAIGLGLLKAVRLSDDPHFVAKLGAWLLIALGGLNLIESFFPKFPLKLHMPKIAGARTNELIKKATVPATIGAGVLVGLCTFPCSGGIYVSVITLLNATATLHWGLAYLGLYNVMFVLPLVIILLAAGNRKTAKAWARWERSHSRKIRLWYGVLMVGLGMVMFWWVLT